MLGALLSFALLASRCSAAVIVPGATWTDTNGNVIQAHGGGLLKVSYPSVHPLEPEDLTPASPG